jgi:hypothetical protein
MNRKTLLIATCTAYLGLGGCGGGGGNSSTVSPSATGTGTSNNSPSNGSTSANNNTSTPATNSVGGATNVGTTNNATDTNSQITQVQGTAGLPASFNARFLEKIGTQLVAIGISGVQAKSSDGTNWLVSTQPSTGMPIESFNGGAYLNSKYFAFAPDNGIYSSSDGLSWTLGTNSLIKPTSAAYGVVSGIGTYVAVGLASNGAVTIARSTDGLAWTSNTNATLNTTWNGVTFGNGRFVAVGDAGKTISSTDGVTWSSGTEPSFTNLQGVAYAGFASKFVAIGNSGRIFNSTDGLTWTPASHPNQTGGNLIKIACGTTKCVSSASFLTDGVASLVFSTDAAATQWLTTTYGTGAGQKRNYGLAEIGSIWVAVGHQGNLMVNTTGTVWTLVPTR